MGFGIDWNIPEPKIPSGIPLLFWIDQNVNNKENNHYKERITKKINIKIYSFDSTVMAINVLKKVEFNKTIIICSGRAYIDFIKIFKSEINDFMICPSVIIFTHDKKKYLDRNLYNKELYIKDEFYNKGGVEDKYKEVEQFITNELEEKIIERKQLKVYLVQKEKVQMFLHISDILQQQGKIIKKKVK